MQRKNGFVATEKRKLNPVCSATNEYSSVKLSFRTFAHLTVRRYPHQLLELGLSPLYATLE